MRRQDRGGQWAPDGVRSSPTGRVPQWVLDEAAGRAPAADAWRSWSLQQPPRRWRGIVRTVLVLAAVGGAAAAVHLGVLPGTAGVEAGGPAGQFGMPRPTPGVGSSDVPLGTPASAPSGGGAYRFVQLQQDGVTPIAYDPCRPVHYVIRPDGAPVGGDQLVFESVARVSAVTGLQFVYDGVTTEGPSDRRESFQPDRYGDRWAPVLITWDDVAEQPDLAADVAGIGGSVAAGFDDGPRAFVTGAVDLDAAQFADILARPDGADVARAVVLHELGHVVGLDHVDDPAQLMYPTTSDVLDFAGGDLAGLARLGAGECVPRL